VREAADGEGPDRQGAGAARERHQPAAGGLLPWLWLWLRLGLPLGPPGGLLVEGGARLPEQLGVDDGVAHRDLLGQAWGHGRAGCVRTCELAQDDGLGPAGAVSPVTAGR
jgi:hypothetical protein